MKFEPTAFEWYDDALCFAQLAANATRTRWRVSREPFGWTACSTGVALCGS